MPNIFQITQNRIGVVHVYSNKKDDEKNKCAYFLTVYDWNQGLLRKLSHVKLFNAFYETQKMYMISLMHYEEDSDILILVLSNVFGDEK